MKKQVLIFASTIAVAGMTVFGLAPQSNAQGSGLKGNGVYGIAGCGLGSLAFGKQEGAVQVVAATLNATGFQTFGITTGTSNCGKGLFEKAAIDSFIKSNAIALENDIARGQGEALATLNNMLGCGESFGTTLQRNFKSIYAERADSSEKIQVLAQSCQG